MTHSYSFLARRILNVFDNFDQMRKGRAYKKGMCRFWPTPESLYPTYPIETGETSKCPSGCTARYCLSNFCLETYFHSCHFPLLRTLHYSTAPADFLPSTQLGYV